MHQPSCPKCKSDLLLSTHYTVLLTFEDWPAIALYIGLVAYFGYSLTLSFGFTSACAVLAILPLMAKPFRKCCCERCGIEFRPEVSSTQE